jgi:hypothetical protein
MHGDLAEDCRWIADAGHVHYRLPGALLARLATAWPNTAGMVSSRVGLSTQRFPLWPFQSAT